MIGCSTLVSMVEWAYMLFVHHCCLFGLEFAFHSGYLVLVHFFLFLKLVMCPGLMICSAIMLFFFRNVNRILGGKNL